MAEAFGEGFRGFMRSTMLLVFPLEARDMAGSGGVSGSGVSST